MSPQTVKMLMMFFVATALLNITNYLFYILYDPPSHRAMQTNEWNNIGTKKPLRQWIQPVRGSPLLSKENPSPTSSVKPEYGSGDYREQSSEVSHFYEYNKGLPKCPQKPPNLGPVNIDEVMSLEVIEKLYETLRDGGIYEESDCVARQSVAIVIPHSGHRPELLKFLYNLHPFLMKQQLNYQIFVVEPNNMSLPLNRGRILNAGFSEVQRVQGLSKNEPWKCVIFHEPVLMPIDTRNLYRCAKDPHQLVTMVNNRTYEYQFGGAFAINPEIFTKVNGFSNLYMGNEAVYEDLYRRFQGGNFSMTKSTTFGKYLHVKGSKDTNQTRYQTIQTASPLNLIDGLSTLTYHLNYYDTKQLYTLIGVDLNVPSKDNTTVWKRILDQASIPTQKKQYT